MLEPAAEADLLPVEDRGPEFVHVHVHGAGRSGGVAAVLEVIFGRFLVPACWFILMPASPIMAASSVPRR
jgi:hypothetical protein